jgi:hypothetical protein
MPDPLVIAAAIALVTLFSLLELAAAFILTLMVILLVPAGERNDLARLIEATRRHQRRTPVRLVIGTTDRRRR